MLPDVIQQAGPKEFAKIADAMKGMGAGGKAEDAEDEDDAPPELVGTFEDAAKK